MGSDEEFSARGLRVEAVDPQRLRLVWEGFDGERRAIVVEQSRLPAVAQELLKRIEQVKIEGLLSLAEARVAGLGFVPNADHLGLTVYVEAGPEQDQEVKIELRLSKSDVASCVASMSDWLKNAGRNAD